MSARLRGSSSPCWQISIATVEVRSAEAAGKHPSTTSTPSPITAMSNFRALRGLKLFSCEWFSESNVLIFHIQPPRRSRRAIRHFLRPEAMPHVLRRLSGWLPAIHALCTIMPKPHYTSLLASPRGGLVILTRAALNCFIQFCAFPPSYSPHPTRRSAAHALFQLVSLVAAITPSKLLFWHPSKLVFPSPCVCGTQRRPCPLSSIFRGPGVVPRTLRGMVLSVFARRPPTSQWTFYRPAITPPRCAALAYLFDFRRCCGHVRHLPRVGGMSGAYNSPQPVCNAPYRHRNPSSALPVNVRAVRCPSPELLNSPFTLPPSHRRVAQPPRAVACNAAPEVLHGLFAVPTDPLRYPRTFFFRFFAFPLSPSRGSSAETRSILRWLGARLWCTSSLRSYRCLSLAPVSPSTSSLLFLRSCRIPAALAACSAAQAVPHSPITFPMGAAALELFLGVWRPREAGLAFPRCVGGAQHRSRRSHSSPTSRRALHPPRPAFRFLEFSPSTSPHPQRFYSMSRWRCAPLNRVRVPVVPASQRRDLPAALRADSHATSPTTAPAFFFDFLPLGGGLLSVAMPWRASVLCLFITFFTSPRPASQCLNVSPARSVVYLRPSLRALAQRPHRAALASFYSIFAAPTAALLLDVLGGPQRPCPRARLSALQHDVINVSLAIIGFFFCCAAPVRHALRVPNSCASSPTRFRKFSPLGQFSDFFFAVRPRSCAAPVLRVSKPNARRGAPLFKPRT
ncbi:hypothetical protein C8J57DRAFT_1569757 [Mycena rebaudengoi]|nr:hypothetical protein C8J57DRAFT_1569757 [Mycena rebaudengoi]